MASEDISQNHPIVITDDARERKRERFRKWWAANKHKRLEKNRLWKKNNRERVRKNKYRAYHRDVKKTRQKASNYYSKARRRRLELKALDYEKHGAKRRAAVLKRYYANRDQIATANKKWRIDNPNAARAIARAWARTNKEKMREWREANPEKIRIYRTTSKARRRALIKANKECFSEEDIRRILKQQKGKCAYCRSALESAFHIDHIQPVSKGGSNLPSNLQLCCADCNHSKNARDPLEFARSLNRLL